MILDMVRQELVRFNSCNVEVDCCETSDLAYLIEFRIESVRVCLIAARVMLLVAHSTSWELTLHI
jgi:hypothetical protein